MQLYIRNTLFLIMFWVQRKDSKFTKTISFAVWNMKGNFVRCRMQGNVELE